MALCPYYGDVFPMKFSGCQFVDVYIHGGVGIMEVYTYRCFCYSGLHIMEVPVYILYRELSVF